MAYLSIHKLATVGDLGVSMRRERKRCGRALRLVALAPMLILGLLSTAASAEPITVDFETFPAGPSNFGPPPQVVSVAGATFSGGIILTNESASINLTNVYATVDCCGYSNPIAIVFDRTIANLSLLVTNNVNATYTLADNLGRSVSLSAPAFNTPLTLTLPFEGITAATVSSIGVPGFDFAIDNVTFTPTEAVVPEPGSILLAGGGIAGMLLRRRNRS
jgi:hypothetical protein